MNPGEQCPEEVVLHSGGPVEFVVVLTTMNSFTLARLALSKKANKYMIKRKGTIRSVILLWSLDSKLLSVSVYNNVEDSDSIRDRGNELVGSIVSLFMLSTCSTCVLS